MSEQIEKAGINLSKSRHLIEKIKLACFRGLFKKDKYSTEEQLKEVYRLVKDLK